MAQMSTEEKPGRANQDLQMARETAAIKRAVNALEQCAECGKITECLPHPRLTGQWICHECEFALDSASEGSV